MNIILGKYGHTKRLNGGEWNLLGMEEYNGIRPDFVVQHGAGIGLPEDEEIINFGQFKFNYKGIRDKTPMNLTHEQAKALMTVYIMKPIISPGAL